MCPRRKILVTRVLLMTPMKELESRVSTSSSWLWQRSKASLALDRTPEAWPLCIHMFQWLPVSLLTPRYGADVFGPADKSGCVYGSLRLLQGSKTSPDLDRSPVLCIPCVLWALLIRGWQTRVALVLSGEKEDGFEHLSERLHMCYQLCLWNTIKPPCVSGTPVSASSFPG